MSRQTSGGHRSLPPALDLRGLLTIDVAAELRKLCQAQLEGTWQLPAELVRRASRAGAGTVEVDLGRQLVVVADDGPGLDPALLHWTALLADPRQDSDQRHRALTALERAGELALLALVGLDGLRELRIDTSQGPQRHSLLLRARRPPVLSSGPSSGGGQGTRVSLRVAGLARRRAAGWLRDVARLAPLRVVVDGVPVADGFAGSLMQAPLDHPLRGRVALVPGRDTAHAYLLAHGLCAGHLTIPDAPAFEAALEMASDDGELAPARLREAAAPWLPTLIDQAARLIVTAAQRSPWPEPHRSHLAGLALQAARRNLRSEEIERAPLLRTVGARGPALASLADLRALAGPASATPGTLLALSPDQDADRYVLGDGPVLVAADAERSLLAEVLGIRLRLPSRRQSSHSLGATLRRLLHDLRGALADGLDLLRHPRRPPALPDELLTPEEHALLCALNADLRARPGGGAGGPGQIGRAILCAGDGPVRRTRDRAPTLILPRHSPIVVACVRAFSAEQGLLRLVQLALAGGTAGRRLRR